MKQLFRPILCFLVVAMLVLAPTAASAETFTMESETGTAKPAHDHTAFAIKKTVEGPGHQGPYLFRVVCTESGAYDVSVKTGQVEFVMDESLVMNETCTVTETQAHGASKTVVSVKDRHSHPKVVDTSHDPESDRPSATITIGDCDLVHFTNTFEEPEPVPIPEPTPTPEPEPEPEPAECPDSGDYTVIFDGHWIVDGDPNKQPTSRGPVNVTVPAGTYTLTLWTDEPGSGGQPQQQWSLVGDGTVVATTTALVNGNLPQSDTSTVVLDADVDSWTAVHAAAPETPTTNSVIPLCAVFKTVPEPEPTPTPTPEPEPKLKPKPRPMPLPTPRPQPGPIGRPILVPDPEVTIVLCPSGSGDESVTVTLRNASSKDVGEGEFEIIAGDALVYSESIAPGKQDTVKVAVPAGKKVELIFSAYDAEFDSIIVDTSGCKKAEPILVSAPRKGGQLAQTGFNMTVTSLLALALISLGLTALAAARKRTS